MKSAIAIATLALLGAPNLLAAQDSEPRNVRLVFQIIEADGFTDVDPAIQDVVDELHSLFRFRGYRLVTTSIMTGTTGEVPERVSQLLSLPDHGQLQLSAFIHPADGGSLRLSVSVDVPNRTQNPTILEVSVRVRMGQTVVLGSTQNRADAAALILTMRAEEGPS